MRTTRVLAASAVAAAALAVAGPAGVAVADSSVMVVPSVIARGGQVSISVNDPKCMTGMPTASSTGFTMDVTLKPGQPAKGTARIKRDAAGGSYDVKVVCDGKTIHQRDAYTVIGGAAQGGLGGSAEQGGATNTDIAVGGSLVGVAALAGGAFWLRRRAGRQV